LISKFPAILSKKMPLYTRTGDKGTTSTLVGRVGKETAQIAALGALDTLHAFLAIVYEYALTSSCIRNEAFSTHLKHELVKIMHDLLDIGTHVSALYIEETSTFCSAIGFSEMKIKKDRYIFTENYFPVSYMEDRIDRMEASTPPLKNFILHTGSLLTAKIHVARTCCRAVETSVTAFLKQADTIDPRDEIVLIYLNRLSDYLFALARLTTHVQEHAEIIHK
jgi:cob(I)alamin adenosyltransferase